jgi:hypothetical protein
LRQLHASVKGRLRLGGAWRVAESYYAISAPHPRRAGTCGWPPATPDGIGTSSFSQREKGRHQSAAMFRFPQSPMPSHTSLLQQPKECVH